MAEQTDKRFGAEAFDLQDPGLDELAALVANEMWKCTRGPREAMLVLSCVSMVMWRLADVSTRQQLEAALQPGFGMDQIVAMAKTIEEAVQRIDSKEGRVRPTVEGFGHA